MKSCEVSGLLEPQTEETVVLILGQHHLDKTAFQLRQQGCGTLYLGLLEILQHFKFQV